MTKMMLGRWLLAGGTALGLFACSAPLAPQVAKPDPLRAQTTWTQVWGDEFNGTSLDSGKWTAEDVGAPRNAELEYYTPEDVYVQGGNLVLRSQKRSYRGYNYTSGSVTSFGKYSFTRGKFEVRAKMPKGKGIWPALWLLGNGCAPAGQGPCSWPAPGAEEIDMLEVLGQDPTGTYQTIHFGPTPNNDSGQTGCSGQRADTSADFHTYTVLWEAGPTFTWLIDGTEVCKRTAPSSYYNSPVYVYLNTAVGGSWPGSPDSTTVFPQYMLVDYVRIYQGEGAPAPTPTLRNPGLEEGGVGTQTPPGWSEWSDTGAQDANYVECGASHSGSCQGTQWRWTPYRVSTTQTVSGLANGPYTLKAWVRSSGGQNQARLVAKNYGGADRWVDIPPINSWNQISIPNIAVTNGTLQLDVWSDAHANEWINYDDLELVPDSPSVNPFVNPGFEQGGVETQTPPGWIEWSDNGALDASKVECGASHSGSCQGTHWRSSAYRVSTSQAVNNVPNGSYTLKAWVRSSGGQNQARIVIRNYGGADRWVDIPAINGWNQISLSNIAVSTGKIQVEVWSDAHAYEWINFDDLELVRQ